MRVHTFVTLLLLSAGARGEALHVGSKSFAENVILGEIIVGLGESLGIKVEHKSGLGGTQIVWKALERGEVDIYPEYTGTLFEEQFKSENLKTLDDLRSALATKGFAMSNPLGFNNSYAIGMKRAQAKKLGIQTISDLTRFPDLEFGFSQEFMTRSEGWPALKRVYALPQTRVRSMDHELSYRALDEGSVAVKDLFTTDAEIRLYDLVALTDDRKLFPDYSAVFIYRNDVLQRYPALRDRLRLLEGAIDDQQMVVLNAKTKVNKMSERQVAREFLSERGWLGGGKADETRTGLMSWLSDRFARDFSNHFFLVMVPLIFNILVGIALGVLATLRPRVGHVLLTVSGIVQTIPSLALLVFMIPVFGIGYPPALFALFLYGLLPIFRNTYTGLTSISPSLLESAEALGTSRWHRLSKIELPLASRQIFAGIKISAIVNVGTATLGAIIGAGGFGEPIMIGIRRDDIHLVLQGAVAAALFAVALQYIFDALERFFVPQGLQAPKGR